MQDYTQLLNHVQAVMCLNYSITCLFQLKDVKW